MKRPMKSAKPVLQTFLGVVVTVFYLFPVYWVIVNSLKERSELFSPAVTLFPQKITFYGYARAIEVGVLRYLVNSTVIATATMVMTLLLATIGAYAMTRIKSNWVNWTLILFLVAQMVPDVLVVTPLYLIFRSLGLLDNYLGLVIANTSRALPLAIIVMRTVMLTVPRSLEEAAKIDGCTISSLLTRIVVPIAKPGLVVTGTIAFLMAFGEFVYAVSFITREAMYPISAGLYVFTASLYGQEWNSAMAYATLLVAPVLIAFLGFQKQIVSGLTQGALK
jgi:ABC-type sugar transport system, permease component